MVPNYLKHKGVITSMQLITSLCLLLLILSMLINLIFILKLIVVLVFGLMRTLFFVPLQALWIGRMLGNRQALISLRVVPIKVLIMLESMQLKAKVIQPLKVILVHELIKLHQVLNRWSSKLITFINQNFFIMRTNRFFFRRRRSFRRYRRSFRRR